MPSAQNTISTGHEGQLRIVIDQTGQNQSGNTSTVRVRGALYNLSNHEVHNTLGPVRRTISGWGNDYNPPHFNFSIHGGGVDTFIDHEFVVGHDPEGNMTVHFAVSYGLTGTDMFQSNKECDARLTLTRIPKRPSPPGTPVLSEILPTSLRVSWTASADTNGSPINNYRLRRWTGNEQAGPYTDSIANNLARNVTGLEPGSNYTFAVYAHNGSADNGGWSNPSPDAHTQLLSGAMIRVNGSWVKAIPYVRDGGVWKMAVPYIRAGGVWKPSE